MYSYGIVSTSVGFNGEIVGISLHDHDWESRSGAHRVAPEAASKVKAQAEAKFHMY
jgi:hypothetical protein